MKKVLIAIMVLFLSTTAMASSEVKKSKTLLKEKVIQFEEFKYKPEDDICFDIYIFTSDCPDGSVYVPQAVFVLVDCDTDDIFDFFIITNEDSYSEFCDL